ncbi:response regulator receiver modulated diguanylate cyclase [Candidatus Magnetobacterium bavaricum]|uniref:diguanylate cyclase n=1 Tax=Candidatus Magnetobacterium bavaricum TaxID=29290 RepID=A0A0F3GPX6_9BACT|nr:response regulator receiver modulated diguanylate cyclase [Candidatus Magnetobacterium bavaricum]
MDDDDQLYTFIMSLFEEEEAMIREAEELLKSEMAQDNAILPHFDKLSAAYKKLLRQTKRIVRMADNLQRDLNVATDTLSILCTIDQLTNVANRRCLEETYNTEWKRSLRNGTPLALIIMDIDFFKQYNDSYGHTKGDVCLQKVSQAIKKSLKRPQDLLARYGGEEFVVILPDTNEAGALNVAEGIRAAIEAQSIPHRTSKVSGYVTISIGVCVMAANLVDDKDVHLFRADQALYKAKEGGRNRVVMWEETQELTDKPSTDD